MKTTVDLDAQLFRRTKIFAAQHGTSLKSIIETALEQVLSGPFLLRDKKRVTFPILKSSRPKRIRLTNAQIEEFLT